MRMVGLFLKIEIRNFLACFCVRKCHLCNQNRITLTKRLVRAKKFFTVW